MKKAIVDYIRLGRIQNLFVAVEKGLTYEDYITHTGDSIVGEVVNRSQEFYETCITRDNRWVYATTPELLGKILFNHSVRHINGYVWDDLLTKTFYQQSFIGHDEPNTLVELEQVFNSMCEGVTGHTVHIIIEIQVVHNLLDKWDIQTEQEALTIKRMSSNYLAFFTYFNKMQYSREYGEMKRIKAKADKWLAEFRQSDLVAN